MWRMLQIADAAFPTGGFAHSGGLEAAVSLGEVPDLVGYVRQSIWQTAYGAVVLVRQSYACQHDMQRWDQVADAFLTSHVANRASRMLGRAFLMAGVRAFPELSNIDAEVRSGRWIGHHAPVFGASCALLELSQEQAATIVLHAAVRSILSAAVRLGIVGPLAAQRIQSEQSALCEEALSQSRGLKMPMQTAPLLELFGSSHDLLPVRLFQS